MRRPTRHPCAHINVLHVHARTHARGARTHARTHSQFLFSLEWFRRRVFELFYYSHVVLFVLIVVVTAKHIGVLPAINVDYYGEAAASASARGNNASSDLTLQVGALLRECSPHQLSHFT